MPSPSVLITGGAGFIGSHVTDELLGRGYSVRVLDCLDPQVHRGGINAPSYLSREAEFMAGDVRDPDSLDKALEGVDAVIHLAAAVGVGQSMYQIAHYTSVNDYGTAVLLEALKRNEVGRLVVASSMSIYGEGAYCDAAGRPVSVPHRKREQLQRSDWEHHDADGEPLRPVPTDETKVPDSASIYALSKFVQERMCLLWGEAYQVPTAALRFFNAYGPRQSLSNPYTGVLAIFASRLLNGESPLVFEDGEQLRDFVSVHDIARCCRLALESPRAAGEVFNVGSGRAMSICEVAREMAEVLDRGDVQPDVVGKYRFGDIRHCFADISKARELLGYQPQTSFADGLSELAEWLAEQDDFAPAGAQQAKEELVKRGLVV